MATKLPAGVLRTIIMALLVLPLVGIMWFFGEPSVPAKPTGRLGEAFEAELLAGLKAAGAGANVDCTMSGKSSVIRVTCRTRQGSSSAIAAQFVARRWTPGTASASSAEANLQRGQDRLKIENLVGGEIAVAISRYF